MRSVSAWLATILIACGCQSGGEPAVVADLIVRNGRVYTFTWGEPAPDGTPARDAPFEAGRWSPDAQALAVAGGRIVFVGSDDGVERYRGAATRVLDVAGATVLPGLVDSHTHVLGLGQLEVRVDLKGVSTEEEAIQRVVSARSDVAPGEWILAQGWDEGAWASRYPTWDLLSEAFPDNPVVLNSLHGFALWANRKAFEAAGIDRDTPDPAGGEILRDDAGEPTGVVLNRAGQLLEAAIPEPTAQELEGLLLAGLKRMARDGFVMVHEAGVDRALSNALESLAREDSLPVRVYAMLSARDSELCREWIERGPDRDAGGQRGMLITRSVKAYYDGALGSRGARLLEDYSDRPGHRGVAGGDYGFDEELVARMMSAGFQAGIHAIGDAGNRETLDFLAGVMESDPATRALRHRIEHAQVVHPDDFARFSELGLIASMEPPHCVEDKAWAEDRLGPLRVQGAYAWRTLREAGARLAFNSDLVGSDHDVFYGLHSAITRRDANLEPPGGWYPEEAMTPEEALRGYTVWGAYAARLENETGSLAPGKWADVTIMDIDPFVLGSRSPDELLSGNIVATLVAGKLVHRAD